MLPEPLSVNHKAPSGPAAIPAGKALSVGMGYPCIMLNVPDCAAAIVARHRSSATSPAARRTEFRPLVNITVPPQRSLYDLAPRHAANWDRTSMLRGRENAGTECAGSTTAEILHICVYLWPSVVPVLAFCPSDQQPGDGDD